MFYGDGFEIGHFMWAKAIGLQYTPSSDEQVRAVWFRLARTDWSTDHADWFPSTSEEAVSSLTVRLHPDSAGTPDTSVTIASTTLPWDSVPSLWPDQDLREAVAVFSTPLHLTSGTAYWFVVDMGVTALPQYGMTVAWDPDLTANQTWSVQKVGGTWVDSSAAWATAGFKGLWFSLETESQALGPRFHVMVDGNGYMTPNNLGSAVESGAVPFSGKIGSGKSKWSDLTFPYSADSWDNWIAGIGTDYSTDRGDSYSLGSGIDTRTRNQATLMPVTWETSQASTRPPRNFDNDHVRLPLPFFDGTTWYNKFAVPVQMPATSVTVAKLRTAIGRYYTGLWYTTHIRIETDNAGSPSGTAVQDDSANDLDWTVAQADLNHMMTWMTWDLSTEVGDNWTTTGNEKIWIIVESTGFPTGAVAQQHYLEIRGTNDYYDTDEYSGSFYPAGYTPKVYDGSSWAAATVDSRTWAIQWNLLDNGFGAQVTDFVYWPDASTLFCVAGKLYAWTEGANDWDGYWTVVSGVSAITDFQYADVFDGKLYVTRGSAGAIKVGTYSAGISWADVTNSVEGTHLTIGNGFLWTDDTAATVKKWNGSAWSSAITVGVTDYSVTGMTLFQGRIHVAKEDGIWYLDSNDVAHQAQDYRDMAHSLNGRGLTNFGELLYYNVHSNYIRWTGATLDYKGPYDDAGFVPEEWTGTIVDTVQAGRHLYCALWASTTGTSQVLAYNGIGWHPVYAPLGTVGNKVNAVYWTAGTATGAGTVTDGGRLWIGENSHARFIELPDRTDNPAVWAGVQYDNYGWMEFPWWDAGLREVDKYFRSIKVETQDPDSNGIRIRLGAYISDGSDDTQFYYFGYWIGGQTIEAHFPPEMYGRAIKPVLGIESGTTPLEATLRTSVIKALTIEALLRPPQTYVHSVQILLGDNLLDMYGQQITSRTASDMWLELKDAAESKTPIRVQFPWGGFDAFITSLSARTIAYKEEGSKPKGEWEKIATVSFVEAKTRGI